MYASRHYVQRGSHYLEEVMYVLNVNSIERCVGMM